METATTAVRALRLRSVLDCHDKSVQHSNEKNKHQHAMRGERRARGGVPISWRHPCTQGFGIPPSVRDTKVSYHPPLGSKRLFGGYSTQSVLDTFKCTRRCGRRCWPNTTRERNPANVKLLWSKHPTRGRGGVTLPLQYL